MIHVNEELKKSGVRDSISEFSLPETYVAKDVTDFLENKEIIEPTKKIMSRARKWNGDACIFIPFAYHTFGWYETTREGQGKIDISAPIRQGRNFEIKPTKDEELMLIYPGTMYDTASSAEILYAYLDESELSELESATHLYDIQLRYTPEKDLIHLLGHHLNGPAQLGRYEKEILTSPVRGTVAPNPA